MTENQKLREALQAISHIDDTTNHSVDASAALDRIGQIARQALALPTAEQVGEREAFEREMRCEEEWGHRSLKKRQNGQYENWQARAALSAGDEVDAQRYRWLADCLNYPEAVTLIADGSLTADALGKAIDTAMRKDKP